MTAGPQEGACGVHPAASHRPARPVALHSWLTARPHAWPPSRRWELALRGVFAGNLFDLGAAASAKHFQEHGASASFASERCWE